MAISEFSISKILSSLLLLSSSIFASMYSATVVLFPSMLAEPTLSRMWKIFLS